MVPRISMGLFAAGFLSVNPIFAEEAKPPPKPIDCFSEKLTAAQGIQCLQQIKERRAFEAMLRELKK